MLRAGEADSEPSAQRALSGFCEAYWPPLYTFLRHRGHPSADAQDLVQSFFVHLFEQNTLSRVDRQRMSSQRQSLKLLSEICTITGQWLQRLDLSCILFRWSEPKLHFSELFGAGPTGETQP